MALEPINGCGNPDRIADVIFVHGLDGDGRTTWQASDSPNDFWPAWLGEEFPDVGIWSLDYDASSMAWKGGAMPLYDRANNSLNRFEQDNIGDRPIGFVCHSLGGLLIKQVLRNAKDSKNSAWQAVIKQTRFIVFLSTPHSGADIANWIQYISKLLRTTVNIRELEAHDPQLRQLNIWYRDHVADFGIKNFVYCEERKTGTSIFGLGRILVVDKDSADPGIPGLTAISLDEDHISICKPVSKDTQVYRQVKRIIDDAIVNAEKPSEKPDKPTPKPETATSETKPAPVPATSKAGGDYSGPAKIEVCDRLFDDWQKLADQLEIPVPDRRRFERGREPQGVWQWLKSRRQLAELEPALAAIGRTDLVEVLRRHPQ